ncbi:MAG: endonuclease/exonuclease/phosphatase family protein [Clostridia bacterium]|nr:endonuclease/exonuclease/phosphatase family protein [Clostridia bacterium]
MNHDTTSAHTAPALRVGSYNIRHGADVSLDISVIAADITAHALDIVGLQEIDQLTSRVNGLDTVRALSDATSYKYYYFAKAINYKGGEYGTAILSRYPIAKFEVIKLESDNKEQRCVGHAVVDVNGTAIDFFNTHLSYESLELRTAQFAQISALLADCDTYILTGDFNTAVMSEFSVLPDATLVNNGSFGTFPSSDKAIDNIVISSKLSVLDAGMGPLGHSDHRLLWAELIFEAK